MEHDFSKMNDRESVEYQLEQWVKGESIHNPVRDECCPDFSCCKPDMLMPKELREKFAEAHKNKDHETEWSILSMALSGLAANEGKNIHIAGESGSA